MKRLCVCGCRRTATTEWLHPTLGTFWFGALCTIRLKPALISQCWTDFPEFTEDDLADAAQDTLTGGNQYETD